MQVVFRSDSWVVKVICACRGFGFLKVEACRVQHDCTSYVKVWA